MKVIDLLNNLKKKYNHWLFKKYNINRGRMFEKIPTIYKIVPLFSPSIYALCEAEEFNKGIKWAITIK